MRGRQIEGRGAAICDELKRAGITHVAWLPCSETHFLSEALLAEPGIRKIPVGREGEAVAICAGLQIGGLRGAVLTENMGMFDFGNVLKWAIGVRAPMLLMVGYVGYRRLRRTARGMEVHGVPAREGCLDYTEPFLNAFGVSHYLIDREEDVARIATAVEEAWDKRMPVAALLTSADGYVAGM